ncbi:hypothetical protein C5Y96_07630 [Blastopirellula marina]|uniref:Uncharacterized protein n=1 Tax=Blastopirellula marina TaxID=124 RepID=A0A2S8FY76_9BACT|nr:MULTISPECIES: hypothetical protein [Pirellulaceae]PQO37020.1 hypothetical protein C5Y96_07630 [Blastopirellula marina]RCS53735.1 hypothetical protein DTL36_07640 [Bremerella cremea]
MGVRKKGRTRFECLGECFVWYWDEWYIRISSEDKSFVIAYFIGDPWGPEAHLEIHGHHFPGIERTERRPVRVLVPEAVRKEFQSSTGAFVNALIRWCLDESHTLKYLDDSEPTS